MAAMSHDRPPANILQYQPKLHPDLAKAIHWCLEADLTQRCPSMEKFLHAVRAAEQCRRANAVVVCLY